MGGLVSAFMVSFHLATGPFYNETELLEAYYNRIN